MINILEHGHNEKPHDVHCPVCKCHFTHTREDCWFDDAIYTYVIKCPECGERIELGILYDK